MNSYEIKQIKKACSISDKVMAEAISALRKKKFKTEKELYKFIIKSIYARGCRLAFKPIVSSGKNLADIHHKANDTRLTNGFIIIDMGAKYNGYCSDITRTVFLGRPSKKDVFLYNLVRDVQETCVEYAYDGMPLNDIDAIARAGFEGYRKKFRHSLGHGVGKKVHVYPSLGPNKDGWLKQGQIVTIEPGIYFKKGIGIRIEDTLLVTKNKPVLLTRATKKMIII